MALSFDQMRELVRTTIQAPAGENRYCYIVEMYDDAVVYELDDQLYRRTYAIVDDQVTLGEPTQVKKQVEFIPLQAACQLMAAAEGDATGYKWRVKVCEFGMDKPGAIWWDKEVLTAALGQFEGAKVFALSEAQHQARPHPFGKSVRDLVGVLQNCQATDGAIYADLIILPAAQWLRDNLVGCADMGLTDVIGLSVDISGKGGTKTFAGKTLKTLTTVAKVTVDVVYDPAAGGQFLTMAAAVPTDRKESEDMKDKLLAALKAARPDQYARVNHETVTENELLDLLAAEPRVLILAEDLQAAVADALLKQNTQTGKPGVETGDDIKLMACELTLERELAASKLAPEVQDHLRTRFEGKVFDKDELRAAIKTTKELIDRVTASGIVTGLGDVRLTVDSLDKAGTYLDDFFAGKVHSFKAAYQDITGDMRITGELRDARRLQAAISSTTFDQILGDSLTRRMVAEYNLAALDDWKKVCTIVPLSDFRQQRRPRMGGYGNLPAVAQSGAYTALTSPADEEATYSPTKRGGTESITLEAIRNDDVGGIRRIPVKLGRAAARTLYVFVFDFFATNPTLYDSVAFFHATHANLGTAALSKATLQAGRLQIMKQTEAGSAEVLGIPPRFLLLPPDLEDTGYELTAVPSAGLFTPTAPDAVRRQTYEAIVVKTWSDVNNWYLTCDPADIPGIEIGFLDGKEEPELFVQDMPNVGSMFSNDQLTYKLRHIYGGVVTDFRGSQGNVVP